MGIYGAYHVANPEKIQMGEEKIIGNQLISHYEDIVSINILDQID